MPDEWFFSPGDLLLIAEIIAEWVWVVSSIKEEYRKNIEKDGALERRFQKVVVDPSSKEETFNDAPPTKAPSTSGWVK